MWFINLFGLEFDSLQLRDQKGTKFSVGSSPGQNKSPTAGQPVTPPPTPPVAMPAAPSLPEMETQMPTPPSPMIRDQLMSSPESQVQGRNKGKQFDSVIEADKSTIETVLFLMDKFAVGDAFIHELSMVIDGMPKSYLIKQCRDKLNSTCSVKPIPGGQCGAQVSFKESLTNKLKQLVTKSSVLHFFQLSN